MKRAAHFFLSDKSARVLRSFATERRAACTVSNAGRFCACECVIDSTRACVCVCEGCRNAEWERVKPDRPMALPLCVRHSLSSSGLKTAEKKRAMAGAPLALSLSLSLAPLSPSFRVWRRGKKNLKQKAWFICKCAAAHTGPPWCTGRGGAESARMRGNKGIVESFDSVFVTLRPSGTCQAGRTLESISLVWNGAAITNCAMYGWVFTHVCFCMCERSACGLHVVWVCVFSTEGVKRQRDTPLSRRPSLSLLCWNWARCTSLDHSKAIKWPLSATGSGSL